MTLENRTVELIPSEWEEGGNLLGDRGDLVDPEKVKFRYEDGEVFKRHVPTPGKRYYGIVEWFED